MEDVYLDQAKAMHWGIYCDFFKTCQSKRLCSEACPSGGSGVKSGCVNNGTSTITIDPSDAEIWKVCPLCGGNVAKLRDGHDVPEMFCEECKEAVEFAKTILRVGRGKARL